MYHGIVLRSFIYYIISNSLIEYMFSISSTYPSL